MKRFQYLAFIVTMFISAGAHAQDMKKFNLYKPWENAKLSLDKAIADAAAQNKNVFVQIGGNWCIWCACFNKFVTKDKQIDSVIQKNFVVYHLNYSTENKNAEILKEFEYPQRFGFPVFIVLDSKGRRLHTQNSSYLEEGKDSYNKDKVIGFFNDWGPKAFDPEQYKNY